jgi:hypothetical protein
MPRRIVRKTLEGAAEGPQRQCYGVRSIVAVPGVRTVEEWVQALLQDGESIVEGLDQPKIHIKRGDVVIGYFEITPSPPGSESTSME